MGAWQRVASVLGFNLGIETMQLIVVAAILPSLILLSRTPAYSFFRLIGALSAGFVSLGWIVERAFGAYATTGIATDSARRQRANLWARRIAKVTRRLFQAEPMPDLQVPRRVPKTRTADPLQVLR